MKIKGLFIALILFGLFIFGGGLYFGMTLNIGLILFSIFGVIFIIFGVIGLIDVQSVQEKGR